MEPDVLAEPYPLEDKWRVLRDRMGAAEEPSPTGVDREVYLDAAERIVRPLAAWQDEHGIIRDPYSEERYYYDSRQGQKVLVFAQTRYIGALGHLIAAGRCEDLIESCIVAYEERLENLDIADQAPEFWVKEMMYAHRALKDRVETSRLRQWEAVWARHDPWTSYKSAVGGIHGANFPVFALTGEFFKIREGVGGDRDFIDQAIAYLAGDFTPRGMYRDPNDPITYSLVVKQQLDLIRHYGYDGSHSDWVAEACRRGGLTSLLFQSTTGVMPFGGRSNQFHLMEGHFACLCETRARLCRDVGDPLMAGAYKRAARLALQSALPWILDMEPFRHTKQGFDPSTEHGVDSGGPYSVYGSLAASLFATSYHLADEGIEERLTPAEIGGFAFDLWPAFHKVFASCGDYHLEVDTRADPHKDATGLGRIHKLGVRPETGLSAPLSAQAEYSFGVAKPLRSLAIGPAWRDAEGGEVRLAELASEIEEVGVGVSRETPDAVAFEVTYRGELGGCREIVESYEMTSAGVSYAVRLDPVPGEWWILVPAIVTDGEANATFEAHDDGLEVTYRGATYRIRTTGPAKVSEEAPVANRNALYRTLRIRGGEIRLELSGGATGS
ncbi:MAG: hypothetical protein QGI83_18965 [Candidatus Latescibacteria bacterium]|jgi:hypothetical protein|nr:hypothetical protein [Candidatus Latescibacterota bacterium]